MNEYTVTPANFSKSLQIRIRQLSTLREQLALEVVPDEMFYAVGAVIEHLAFLQADLQHDLDNFNRKYGVAPRSAPIPPAPHKGMR